MVAMVGAAAAGTVAMSAREQATGNARGLLPRICSVLLDLSTKTKGPKLHFFSVVTRDYYYGRETAQASTSIWHDAHKLERRAQQLITTHTRPLLSR